jgi:ABC-2 type transport system permease protein
MTVAVTASSSGPSPGPSAGQAGGGSTLRSARGLALRGLRSIRRLPSAFFPALAMPIFQTIAFSGTFFAITKIPGFPTDRSVNWYLPFACCMGSGFSGVGLGFSTVRDIESGFFDRLRMAPSPRLSLIIGPLFTAWIRVLIVITTALIVGFLFGARLTDGPIGLVTVYVAGLGVSTVAAGWGLGLAYRFGDMRAAALMQLTLFNAIFLSNAQAPLNVMTGWLHSVARINPFTNILRLAREGFLGGVTWQDTWGGMLAIVGLSALTLTFAYRGLAKLAD